MSIPNDYRNLADKVAGYAHRNEAIPPRTAAGIAMEAAQAGRPRHPDGAPGRGPRAVTGLRRCRVTSRTPRRCWKRAMSAAMHAISALTLGDAYDDAMMLNVIGSSETDVRSNCSINSRGRPRR